MPGCTTANWQSPRAERARPAVNGLTRLRARVETWLTERWYGEPGVLVALRPLAWLFKAAAARNARRGKRYAAAHPSPVPVIVVGNLVAGGTGKTPVVSYLAERLTALGARPGIVARGYGGKVSKRPRLVTPASDPYLCGDEAVELAQATGCPVVVCADRPAAVRWLAELLHCSVVVSDDGLQHYRMDRALELVLIDAERQLGNGELLPVGPLRELPARLRTADQVLLVSGGAAEARTTSPLPLQVPVSSVQLRISHCRPLLEAERRPIEQAPFSGEDVVALSAIGNPARFHADLRTLGCSVLPRTLADHAKLHQLQPDWPAASWVVVTAKDAVKLRAVAASSARSAACDWLSRVWVAERQVVLADEGAAMITEQLEELVTETAQLPAGAAHS